MKKIIAKIVNTHGLKGQLKILPIVDDKVVFDGLKKFEISGVLEQFECEKIVKSGNVYLLKMVGYDDINLVEKYKGHEIVIEQTEVQLSKNQYFVSDLIGCEIMFENKVVGKIKAVENYGASDILVFADGKKEMSVSFVDYFFDKIDVENKVLVANDHFFEGVV